MFYEAIRTQITVIIKHLIWNVQFLEAKFSIYLNRHVFIMLFLWLFVRHCLLLHHLLSISLNTYQIFSYIISTVKRHIDFFKVNVVLFSTYT